MQLDMERTDWNPKKPYDLRERLFEFGCLVIRLVQYLHTRGPVAMKLAVGSGWELGVGNWEFQCVKRVSRPAATEPMTTHDFEEARMVGEAKGFGGLCDVPVVLLKSSDDDLPFGLSLHRLQGARRR